MRNIIYIIFASIYFAYISIVYANGIKLPYVERELNTLERIFIESNDFELSYSWDDLSDELKQSVTYFTNLISLATFGYPYTWSDALKSDDTNLSIAQIIYAGKNEDIEFVYFKIAHLGHRIIVMTNNPSIEPKNCIYDINFEISSYDSLQFFFKLDIDDPNNFSEGVKIISCIK